MKLCNGNYFALCSAQINNPTCGKEILPTILVHLAEGTPFTVLAVARALLVLVAA